MSDANANISVSIDTSAALAQLKELQRQISLFHTNVTRSTSAAALAQRDLQKSLIDDINATGKFAASLTRIKTSAESFTDSLERNKFSMREYFRYAAASTKTFGRMFGSEFETVSRVAEERVKTLQTQYIKLGRDASGALQSIAVRPLTLNMKDYGTQTALAAQKQALFNQLMKQGSTNLLNFGKNTQWAGRQLMVGFTIPLTMLGSTASKVFMDMEAQAIKFKKVYGDLFTPQAETEAALENIKELGRMFARYGVAITDTMGIAAEAAAAGFQGQDLMRQTREATRLSVLGEIDRQQALKTTMALQNAFGLSSDELAGKINFLNAVENQTVTSLNDITEAIPRVAPVIKQLGGDVEDLAYFLTAMKEGGINAAEGANALKSGLASIINPTGKAAAMFEKLNINVQDIVTRNKGNLRGTIQEFAGALDRLDPLNRAQALEQLFGKFQLARVSALFANIAKDGSQASKVLGIASTSFEDLAATADNELGLIEQSASTKFKAAVENLKISIAPVGEEFLKAVTPIVEFFGDIADKFNNLSDRSKRIITILVGVVGAIGPVFLMTFGLLANLVANGLKLFNNLRNGFLRVTSQSNILAEQTQYLTEAQSQAAAVAHSLDQTHANLIQTFNVEAGSLSRLAEVYDRATRAGALFAARNPASMNPGFTQPKKYAKGVVSVPGPKGAGDVVPAMLSPGEAVIPAKQTQKYGALIQGIVADNIPGYAQSNVETGMQETLRGIFVSSRFVPRRAGRSQSAGERAQVNVPNAYELGHFSEGVALTGRELREIVENESATLRQVVEDLINSTENGLEQLFRVFTNEVTVQSKELNQALGEVGSGRLASKELFRTESVQQAGAYNAPLIARMKESGASSETISNAVERLSSEFEQGIQQLGDKATVTAEEVNAITDEAYRIVSSEIEEVRLARESMRSLGAIRQPGADARVPFQGGYNTTSQKKKVNAVIQEQIPNLYPEKQALIFTGPEARQVGIQNAEALSQIFDRLSKDAKIRVSRLVGDVKAMSEQVVEEARRAGIDIGEYLVLGIAQGTESQSPSKAAKREGKNVVDGLNQGMREGVDDVTATGQTLGRAATSGVSSGVRQSSIKAPGVIAAGAPAPAPLVIRTETENRMAQAAADQAAADAQAAQQQKENTDAIKKSTKSYTAYNGKLAGASMALSSLSGVGIMFGGAIGEVSQKIFALSSALFALQTITQMLTKEQFLAYIAKRAEIASSAVAAATRTGASAADAAVAASTAVALRNAKAAGEAAKGVAKSGSLISRTFATLRGFISKALGPISKALRFISAFIPLPAKIVIGLLSLVGGILFYKKKQDEASGALSDFATVARNTKDQLKTYGEIFNVVPGKLITEQSNATPLRKDKRTQVDVIRENEKFIADNQQTIDALKGLSREDALDALMMKGLELRAKGFAEEQVKAILIALAEESGRTDINLNFKGTKFTDQALTGIKGVVTGLAKDVNKEYTSIISNIEAKRKIALDKIKQSFGPNLTKEQQQAVANAIAAVNKQYDDQLAYELERGGSQKKLEEFTQILGTQMAVIGTALREGVISVKQYNTSWNSLVSSLDTLNPKLRETATALLLENALKEQDADLAKYVKSLGNATQQTLMLQAATLGLTAEIQMYANALSAQQAAQQSGTTTGGGARIFETDSWVIQGEAQLKKAIAARIKLYKALAKASKDLFKDLNGGTKEKTVLEKIQEEIDLRKNQTKALQRLAKAGVEAETALNILNDPKAAKAIASANVTQLKKYVDLLKELNTVTQKYKATQDAFKTEDEIFKTQIEYIQNILDYEKYVYDLRYEKDLERIDREETRYDYALKQIEREEKLVNKFYDEQFKALDDLSRKQEQFNALQQGKFSLVQALSQGDMNAAASAIQNIRDQEAKNQLERRRQELEFRKEQEISAIRKDGLTKEEIEKRKDINDARRDEIEYEKETFAASQQRFGFTRRQLDLIAEGLDLAKNANINVNSKTFLQNIMNAVAGDADALAASVKESATAFNTYATEVESLRSKMGLQIISIVDMFKTAKQNAKELAEINAIIAGKQPTPETQTGGSTGAGTGTPPSDNPFVPSPPTGRRRYDDLYDISKQPKAKRPTALQDRLRQLGLLFNVGGKVMGPGTSTSDSIPALLSDGEYVIRASSVNKYGVGLFEELNAGKFAKGGMIQKFAIGGEPDLVNPGNSSPRPSFSDARTTYEAKQKQKQKPKSFGNMVLENVKSMAETGSKKTLEFGKDILRTTATSFIRPVAQVLAPSIEGVVNSVAGMAGAKPNFKFSDVTVGGANLYKEKGYGFKDLGSDLFGIAATVVPVGKLAKPALSLLGSYGAAKAGMNIAPNVISANLDALAGFSGLNTVPGKIAAAFGKGSAATSSIDDIYKTDFIDTGSEIFPSYTLKGEKAPIVFKGMEEDLSGLAGKNVEIVPITPEGILTAAAKRKPKDKKIKQMLDNIKAGGKDDLDLLDAIGATSGSVRIGGNVASELPLVIASLAGNKNAKELVKSRVVDLNKRINPVEELTEAAKSALAGRAPALDNISLIHSTKHPIVRNEDGTIDLFTGGTYSDPGDLSAGARSTIHFTLDAPVQSHLFGDWDNELNDIIYSRLSDAITLNNVLPKNMRSIDTWFSRNPGEALKLPKSAVVVRGAFKDLETYSEELVKRGLLKPGQPPPSITFDANSNEILRLASSAYRDFDKLDLIRRANGILGRNFPESMATGLDDKKIQMLLEEVIQVMAKGRIGVKPEFDSLGQWSLNNEAKEETINRLAKALNINQGLHFGSASFYDERNIFRGGIPDSIESLRTIVQQGRISSFMEKKSDDYFADLDFDNINASTLPPDLPKMDKQISDDLDSFLDNLTDPDKHAGILEMADPDAPITLFDRLAYIMKYPKNLPTHMNQKVYDEAFQEMLLGPQIMNRQLFKDIIEKNKYNMGMTDLDILGMNLFKKKGPDLDKLDPFDSIVSNMENNKDDELFNIINEARKEFEDADEFRNIMNVVDSFMKDLGDQTKDDIANTIDGDPLGFDDILKNIFGVERFDIPKIPEPPPIHPWSPIENFVGKNNFDFGDHTLFNLLKSKLPYLPHSDMEKFINMLSTFPEIKTQKSISNLFASLDTAIGQKPAAPYGESMRETIKQLQERFFQIMPQGTNTGNIEVFKQIFKLFGSGEKFNKGGIVKYFANGGYARGTDTIPAMLSQGEYVVKKKAVDALGLDTMNKINQGQMPAGNTNSVYNYSLSVNVSNSNANPNDIARTVINQIRQIEGQRIRGNR